MPRRHLLAAAAAAAVTVALGTVVPASAQPDVGPADENPPYECEPGVMCDFAEPYGDESIQTLDAFYPKNRPGVPAVLVIHGGGWSGGSSVALREEAIYFAKNGVASFAINYTLADEDPPAGESGSSWPTALEDVALAATWVEDNAASMYGVDGTRLAAFGGSAGGHLAGLLGTWGPDFDQAVDVRTTVSWSGPMVFDPDLGDPEGYGAEKVRVFLGCEPEECPTRYDNAQPISHVDGDEKPFLLVNSKGEPVTAWQTARRMELTLEAAGGTAEFLRPDGNLHSGEYACVEMPLRGAHDEIIDLTLRWLHEVLTDTPVTPTDDFVRCTGDGNDPADQ